MDETILTFCLFQDSTKYNAADDDYSQSDARVIHFASYNCDDISHQSDFEEFVDPASKLKRIIRLQSRR